MSFIGKLLGKQEKIRVELPKNEQDDIKDSVKQILELQEDIQVPYELSHIFELDDMKFGTVLLDKLDKRELKRKVKDKKLREKIQSGKKVMEISYSGKDKLDELEDAKVYLIITYSEKEKNVPGARTHERYWHEVGKVLKVERDEYTGKEECKESETLAKFVRTRLRVKVREKERERKSLQRGYSASWGRRGGRT